MAAPLSEFAKNRQFFEVASTEMSGLRVHNVVLDPLDPADLDTKFGALNLSYIDLQTRFKALIPDYGEKLVAGKGSLAVALCSKVLYEQGPTKKTMKATDRMSSWWEYTLNDQALRDKNDGVNPTLNIYSFAEEAKNVPVNALSVKKASLLLIPTLEAIIDYYGEKPNSEPKSQLLLTPLAAAAFSVGNITKIAEGTGISIGEWCKIINASCAGGGHVLEYSNGTIAAVAAMNATKNLSDRKLAESIVSKVVKQYTAAGKPFTDSLVEAAMAACQGGWPSGWNFQRMMVTRENVDKEVSPLDEIKIAQLKAIKVNAVGPAAKKPAGAVPRTQ